MFIEITIHGGFVNVVVGICLLLEEVFFELAIPRHVESAIGMKSVFGKLFFYQCGS